MTYDVVVDGKTHRVELTKGESTWQCTVDGESIEVDAALTARDILSLLIDGKAYEIKRERSLQGELHMVIGSARYAVDVQDPRSLRTRRAAGRSCGGPVEGYGCHARQNRAHHGEGKRRGQGGPAAPRNGSHEDAERDQVSQGGKVQKILTSEGSTVNAGDALAVIE